MSTMCSTQMERDRCCPRDNYVLTLILLIVKGTNDVNISSNTRVSLLQEASGYFPFTFPAYELPK